MTTSTLSVDVGITAGALAIDARFDAKPGVTVLFGPSGSGKSTLLDVVAGLRVPMRGTITLGESVFFDAKRSIARPARERRIGYVLQSLALFPHRDVWGNVTFATNADHGYAQVLLERLGLGAHRHRAVATLSGGEQQRVALARSLASRPDVLLLDEPLSALDRARRGDAIALVREVIREREIPVVWVTHDHEEAETVGDALVALQAGRVVKTGAPVEVLDDTSRWDPRMLAPHDNRIAGEVLRARDDAHDGETVFGAHGLELHARPSSRGDGEQAEFVVRAADVTITLDSPGRTSAGNVFAGTVLRIEPRGRAMVVTVDAGIEIRAEVTRAAVERLSLREGLPVWVLFKTRACFVR